MRAVIVLAGNHREYHIFERQYSRQLPRFAVQLYYAGSYNRLLGIYHDAVIVFRVGTWYKHPNIVSMIRYIRSTMPNASWRFGERVLYHVFAVDEADFIRYCHDLFLEPHHDAVYVTGITPDDLALRCPGLSIITTLAFQMQAERSFRNPDWASRPYWADKGVPTSWRERNHLPKWPEWLDADDRAFLEQHLPESIDYRRVCMEMLEEVRMGRPWAHFAQHESFSHLTYWAMHTHKMGLRLGRLWAAFLMDQYNLCGYQGAACHP